MAQQQSVTSPPNRLRRAALALAFAVSAFAAIPAPAVPAPVVLTEGHSEIHFSWQAGSGLHLAVWDHDRQALLDPALTIMQVLPAARLNAPAGAAWAPLGVPAGTSLWVVPQTQQLGVLWFGTRSVIDSNLLRPLSGPDFGSGQLSLHLIGVSGSGPAAGGRFSLYTTDAFGSPTFRFRTDNGIDESDVIAPINAQSHTHYHWAFTAPGDYEITVEARATLRATGEPVSARATYHFQVLEPLPPGRPAARMVNTAAGLELHWDAHPGARYTIWHSTDLRRWTIDRVVTADYPAMALPFPSAGAAAFYRVPGGG